MTAKRVGFDPDRAVDASGARPVPRLAVTRAEAAEALGVGLTTFKTRIAPHLRVVRRGKVRLYPIRDLERWLEQNAERPLAEEAAILRAGRRRRPAA